MFSIVVTLFFLTTLVTLRSTLLFGSSFHWCLHCNTALLLTHLVSKGLGQCSIDLNMIAASLKFFTTHMEISFLLSGILPPTKTPGILITSQNAVMSSFERPVGVCGKSIPWSSTSFWTTVRINHSLRNIPFISSWKVRSGYSAAGM